MSAEASRTTSILLPAGVLAGDTFTAATEMQNRVARAATMLAAVGVTEETSVALLLRNGRPFIEATLAVQYLGAIAVPINWHLAPDEIAYVLKDCGASVLIVEADLVSRVTPTSSLRFFVVGGEAPRQWDTMIEASEVISQAARTATPSMIYTSGTTGRPKGVRRIPGSEAERETLSRARQRIYGSEPGMRLLLSAPLYHAAPNYIAFATFAENGFLALQQKFDAETTLELIERHRITHMFMVPTMFVRLLALPENIRSAYDVSSLRFVLHAGAPCPIHVKRAMIDWWGPVLTEYYASTESGPLTFTDSIDWLAHPGTVGRPLDGVQLAISDDAGGRCMPGVAGEICVERGIQADFTYHGDEAKRAAMQTEYGMATGDVGYFNQDGFLFICDRKIDMIISGGVNIYPAEIEAAFLSVPGVADVAVIGVPDDEFGEAAIAIVQRTLENTDLSADEIVAQVGDRLARFKLPRKIIFDDLPRDDSGKVFKRKLREQITRTEDDVARR